MVLQLVWDILNKNRLYIPQIITFIIAIVFIIITFLLIIHRNYLLKSCETFSNQFNCQKLSFSTKIIFFEQKNENFFTLNCLSSFWSMNINLVLQNIWSLCKCCKS